MADPPAGAAVPENDGADAGLGGFQAGDDLTILDEHGTGLNEFLGGDRGGHGFATEDGRGTAGGFEPHAATKRGCPIPRTGGGSSRNEFSKRLACRGEKSSVDGSQSAMGAGDRGGIRPAGPGAGGLVGDDESVAASIESDAFKTDP